MRRVSAIAVGCVLVLSGILKLMDPVGTGLLMESYSGFLHLSFLKPAGLPLGVLLSLFESVLGTALVTGVFKKVAGIISGTVLGFFTVLTAVMWFCDAPMDCGCFGEAVHLSHLQSLVKNLVLMALWAFAFLPFDTLSNCCRKVKYATFALVSLSVCAFSVYSLLSVPLMDFTPFAPGEELFNEQTYAMPEAPMLSFCDEDGEYADSLALGARVLVISLYNASEPDPRSIACIEDAQRAGMQPLLLVSGDVSAPVQSYRADRRMLMTLNRSNGGATYIADGQIIAKWPVRSLPDASELAELAKTSPDESVIDENTPKRLKLQGFLLYVFAVLLLI